MCRCVGGRREELPRDEVATEGDPDGSSEPSGSKARVGPLPLLPDSALSPTGHTDSDQAATGQKAWSCERPVSGAIPGRDPAMSLQHPRSLAAGV